MTHARGRSKLEPRRTSATNVSKAEEQRQWEAQRQKARAKAAEQNRPKTFAGAMDDWRAAQELRAFCAELEDEILDNAGSTTLRQWID